MNPNIGVKPAPRKIPVPLNTFTTTTTTLRPLTTISATLKSRTPINKQINPPQGPPRQQQQQQHQVRSSDSAFTESKDAPVAEALRGDYRRQRRPISKSFYSGGYFGSPYSRSRRRPNPKPYYSPPSYYNSPYEDYRFETDFLDPSPYVPKSKKKPVANDNSKDYGMGIIDTDIGQFYDSSSATYRVGPYKSQSYDSSSGYGYSSGSGAGTGAGTGSGTYDYASDLEEVGNYKPPATKPKHTYKYTSPKPPKQSSTRHKYNSLTYDETEYRYPTGESSGYGTSAPGEQDDAYAPLEQSSYSGRYNPYAGQQQQQHQTQQPQQGVYQVAPKPKPRPKPIKPSTTTTSPIKISGTSIDVLTKPLGSATFNLNLSPGTVYSPPQISYNPPGTNYRPIQPIQQIQPVIQQIPIQPPATSYGVPIAPPLNSYTYPNPYQNSYSYPAANQHSNYIPPSSISLVNSPGQFAEPPPLGKQQLADVDVRYNIVQSSYDATPKAPRPTKRKPTKVNSKRVTQKPPPLNTDEELANDENNDYAGESYSYFKTMSQPALPIEYDQDEFHTVKNNKRKNMRPSSNYREQDGKIQRTTKRPKLVTEVTFRIPDEDYLDDLVKVVQTTRRPTTKKKATTHTLDTDDLREAYESDLAYYPKPKQNKNRNHQYTSKQPPDYDEDNSDDGGNIDEDYENDRISRINSKEETNKSNSNANSDVNIGQDSIQTPYWDKSASIYKQYGIRARNDNFPIGLMPMHGLNGFRPIRNEDRSDVFLPSSINQNGNYRQDIGTVAVTGRIASTLRSITTPKTTTLYVWDGKELPKNHKLI